jgi:Serine hydroxymethyltransferase
MEKACDEAHITLNKNAVVGDISAMNPGGVRIGAGASRVVQCCVGVMCIGGRWISKPPSAT